MIRRGTAALMLVASPALMAAIQPHPTNGDPHSQVVDYVEGETVELHGIPGYALMIQLSPDEQIRNVAIGDSGAWQVSANKNGDRLFLKPVEAEGATNMTVVTSVRTYMFDLLVSGGASFNTPYIVQFRYPAVEPEPRDVHFIDVAAISKRLSRYKVSGDRNLRPSGLSNDGQHTYISWPRGAAIPAVYAPDRSGGEMLLNGMMGTDDVYVVDSVPQTLIFRIDRTVARADRINPRKVR